MIPHKETLIRGIDHDRIVFDSQISQRLCDRTDTLVDSFDAAKVIFRIALELPSNQSIASEFLTVKVSVLGTVSVTPDFHLFG